MITSPVVTAKTLELHSLPALPRNAAAPGLLRAVAGLLALASVLLPGLAQNAAASGEQHPVFKRVPTQYIAALGDPGASSGGGAQHWGLWRKDPGPRGVQLKDFEKLENAGGVAPARWLFDRSDWWLEENGLIMEQPEFPISPGKYIVTGNREKMGMLTIYPPDASGDSRWELKDASLHDVTHLGCRSARYTPAAGEGSCSPARAPRSAFRVSPGAEMPSVSGCHKQDYAVLFILAVDQTMALQRR